MTKKNLFVPELQHKTSRSAFDLSRRVISSAKAGELLPCFVEDMLPGDHIKINPKLFCRLANLNTSNFARINQYVNFYFVPYRLLYRDFNTFSVNRSDAAKQASSILSQHNVPSQLPHVHSTDLRSFLFNSPKSYNHDSYALIDYLFATSNNKPKALQVAKGTLNRFGINRFDNALKLLQYLGYYDIANVSPITSNQKNILLNLFPLLAYQKVYCDFYRNQQWESDQPNTYNVDYLSGSGHSLDIPISSLFDSVTAPDLDDKSKDKSYTLFKSFDDTLFDLRYVNNIKDTLFGVVPTAQYGAASTVSTEVALSSKRDLLGFNAAYIVNNDSFNDSNARFAKTENFDTNVLAGYAENGTGTAHAFNNKIVSSDMSTTLVDVLQNLQSTFTIANLRAAQALQKFREVSLSNNSDYKSQIEAHFGVKVSSLMSSLCDYLGGFSSSADISTVTNTNITEDNVANYSAIGSMSNNNAKEIEFTCREHGIIIGVSYVLPLSDIQPIGYDVTCLRSEFEDYAIPEFDRLGNEEVDARLFLGSYFDDNKSHLGYGPRYYDYKTKYDICLGDFNQMSGGTQPNFVVNYNAQQLPHTELGLYLHSQNWFKRDIFHSILSGTVDALDFKVLPRHLNNIFNVMTGNGHDDFSFDQFYNVFDFNVTCTRNLSYDGMPY